MTLSNEGKIMTKLRSVSMQAAVICMAALGLAEMALAAPATMDGAKKEGTVVWYATMETKDMNRVAAEFTRTHPGIAVQSLRLGSSQLPVRIVTEQRGGKYNADVVSGDYLQFNQLILGGSLDKYAPPVAGKFIKGTFDPNGYWTNLYQNTTVIAWNPQRLAADHLKPPTSFADFAKPEWKGKFGLDTGALNWYMGMLQHDKSGGADLAKRITANAPVKTTGHTQTIASLEAGEFDATPTAYGYMAYQEKAAGKAVDYSNPPPVFVTLTPIGLAKNAPHPNAARVFIDWMTSRDGQTFMVKQAGGEVSSRTDVDNNKLVFDPRHPYIVIDVPDSAQYNVLQQQFRTMLDLPG
jgi:iron(III) transport system substrate-binding protein